ncbi:MAG TPA: VOC family protein [Aeromicrobium sp.]|nr:VOC family protein [Aeromicrobium sp.]
MKVLFVASFSPIVVDPKVSAEFYGDALGIEFEQIVGNYSYTHQLDGVKHFGLWPLSEAAQACFGASEWPADVPIPQACVEFEVEDAEEAAGELAAKGYELIHGARTEPWEQITARLLSPEGLLVAVCYTPWFHEENP